MTDFVDVELPLKMCKALRSTTRKPGFLERLTAVCLLPIVLFCLAIIWVIVIPMQGRPYFYVSERMRTPREGFPLVKIRTMHPVEGFGKSEWCDAARVTTAGRVLRKYRLDELPQIFNVIRGDIGFIGPRPPSRRHVEAYPDLFAAVLQSRPGITGLATVMVHGREERLLSRCTSSAEAERIYLERCVPIKARIDQIYRRRRSFRLDVLIIWRTFSRLASITRRRDAKEASPAK